MIERVRPDAVVLELDQERLDITVANAMVATSAEYGADLLAGAVAAERLGAIVVLGDAKARSLPDLVRARLLASPSGACARLRRQATSRTPSAAPGIGPALQAPTSVSAPVSLSMLHTPPIEARGAAGVLTNAMTAMIAARRRRRVCGDTRSSKERAPLVLLVALRCALGLHAANAHCRDTVECPVTDSVSCGGGGGAAGATWRSAVQQRLIERRTSIVRGSPGRPQQARLASRP